MLVSCSSNAAHYPITIHPPQTPQRSKALRLTPPCPSHDPAITRTAAGGNKFLNNNPNIRNNFRHFPSSPSSYTSKKQLHPFISNQLPFLLLPIHSSWLPPRATPSRRPLRTPRSSPPSPALTSSSLSTLSTRSELVRTFPRPPPLAPLTSRARPSTTRGRRSSTRASPPKPHRSNTSSLSRSSRRSTVTMRTRFPRPSAAARRNE